MLGIVLPCKVNIVTILQNLHTKSEEVNCWESEKTVEQKKNRTPCLIKRLVLLLSSDEEKSSPIDLKFFYPLLCIL